MSRSTYAGFRALDPFFDIVMKGLSGLVDGEHYFEAFAEHAIFESCYTFPGWPEIIRGRASLIAAFTGYGDNIELHAGDSLVIHRTQDGRTVILEYDVHGTILASGRHYHNRFISVIAIEDRKIVHWRDYMDSFGAWIALNGTP